MYKEFTLFLLLFLLAVCFGQDPQPCPENPIVLTGSSFLQYIYSPYDERKNYPPNTDCRFVLLGRNPQNRLHLTIIESELEEPVFTDCKDYVSIRDGNHSSSPEVIRWCGTTAPKSLSSSTEALYVHFHSDNLIQRRGFNLSFVDFELPGCPPDWISSETHCYKLYTPINGFTWLDAQKECTYERSNLLTFKDNNEYSFVLDKLSYAHTYPWIGYNDAEDEEHFESIIPKELLWPQNFPAFSGDHTSKDCVYLDFTIKKETAYVVDDCRTKRPFICKKENDGSTIPILPPINLIHQGLEEAGITYALWLIILGCIFALILIWALCYMCYKKRANNRVGNLDQNQRLVTGATSSTVITTTKTHANPNSNSKTQTSANDNHHMAVSIGGSASKSKDPHGVVRPLRQTSTDKNRIKTEVASDGHLSTRTDSPRFNMAANQPGAITVFNAQHVEHLEKEQQNHEKIARTAAIAEMPLEEEEDTNSHGLVQTVIDEENGNLEVENIIRNHVVLSDDDSFVENEKIIKRSNIEEKLDEHVSIVDDEIIEEALHPSHENNNNNNPTFSYPIAISSSNNKTSSDNPNADDTGINLSNVANTGKEDKTAMTDPASTSIQSEDFDGIQMSPMNPHTQKKQRRSHIHILSNVDAKTPEEFWEH